jgi:hypothetical protein
MELEILALCPSASLPDQLAASASFPREKSKGEEPDEGSSRNLLAFFLEWKHVSRRRAKRTRQGK